MYCTLLLYIVLSRTVPPFYTVLNIVLYTVVHIVLYSFTLHCSVKDRATLLLAITRGNSNCPNRKLMNLGKLDLSLVSLRKEFYWASFHSLECELVYSYICI